MRQQIVKLATFPIGISLGILIGFSAGRYLFCFKDAIRLPQTKEQLAVSSAETTASRLFPEMSILDIYKNGNIIDILRNPPSIIIYSNNSQNLKKMQKPITVGEFDFYYEHKKLSISDKSALSICFRSVNAFEVGLGYPCNFSPTYLVRFVSESGSDTVDFLFSPDCAIAEWYFNGEIAPGAVSRIKFNETGNSIVSAALTD